MTENHTIAAIASGEGGAVSLIRVSGEDAIVVCDRIFKGIHGKRLIDQKGFALLYGTVESDGELIDDVLVSVFRAPHSYTGENMVEISCHGSHYIKNEIMRRLIACGAQAARAGEFTLRAFLNGKLDLSQAEAVADLIASDSRESHALAVNQMRGGYSDEFGMLREKLLELASLLELELDFGEEDVEFADRTQLTELIGRIADRIQTLKDSFALGNVIKNGVPVAIVGSPNVGKSTLLNALLKEERALVSDIAGTTRDVIEDVVNIKGVQFRFIDTAGIRQTYDVLESMGIERTFRRIGNASVILLVAEATEPAENILSQLKEIDPQPRQHMAIILNKIDQRYVDRVEMLSEELRQKSGLPVFAISAKTKLHIDSLTDFLHSIVGNASPGGDIIISNARHYESLINAHDAILRAQSGLASGLTGDLLAEDIRDVLHHLGLITGEITTEDVLGSIFSKFCIGK